MTTIYTKYMLPWQPYQDVLIYFLVKVLNFTIIFYSPQCLKKVIFNELINVAIIYSIYDAATYPVILHFPLIMNKS